MKCEGRGVAALGAGSGRVAKTQGFASILGRPGPRAKRAAVIDCWSTGRSQRVDPEEGALAAVLATWCECAPRHAEDQGLSEAS